VDYLLTLTLAYREGTTMRYADARYIVSIAPGQQTSDILTEAYAKLVAEKEIDDTPGKCAVVAWNLVPNVLVPEPVNQLMTARPSARKR
jgi:hypothetical protein